MKTIDENKLWAYLDAKLEEINKEYKRQSDIIKNADNTTHNNMETVNIVTNALFKRQGEIEKQDFIIELKNAILNKEFDA